MLTETELIHPLMMEKHDSAGIWTNMVMVATDAEQPWESSAQTSVGMTGRKYSTMQIKH